ncbi:hypothetical protein [Blastococcus sp. SYSU D00820]
MSPTRAGRPLRRAHSLWRRIAASAVVLAGAAAFPLVAHAAAFDPAQDPFPHSVSGQ